MTPAGAHDFDVEALAANTFQASPFPFVEEILGERFWSKQTEILGSVWVHPRTLVRSCHGAGKTRVAASAVLAFLYAWPGSVVITTAPTGRQVKTLLWGELRSIYSQARVPLGGELAPASAELWISRDLKWYAFGFSTDDGDSFQGPHAEHILAVIDEASGVDPSVWTAVDALLTSEHSRLLAIGNPTDPSSQFAREHKIAGAHRISIAAYETPNFTAFGVTRDDVISGAWRDKVAGRPMPFPALVTPAWVADKVARWGPDSPLFRSRCDGEFPESSTDTLISLASVEAALAREVEPRFEPNVLGVDVARFGDDRTVIAHRLGSRIRIHAHYAKQGTMETVGRVVEAVKATGATAVRVDDSGVGGGVTDRLRELVAEGELEVRVEAVNVGERAELEPDRFANLRSEVWWGLREELEQLALEGPDELLGDLASIRYRPNSRGRIVLESKEEMKARGLPSPDFGDAIVLARKPPKPGGSWVPIE